MKKLLFILFLLPTLLQGQTAYYVATTGNNTNPGTQAQPWLTLAYATAHATTTGDVIYLATGTYTETAQSTLADGVSLQGTTGVVVTTNIAANPLIVATSVSSASLTAGNQTISYIVFNGNSLTGYGAIRINFRSNVKIHHCVFTNWKYYATWFDGTASAWNVEPSNNRTVNNEVYNCTYINNNERAAGVEGGHIRIEGQDQMLIHNNVFDQTTRAVGYNGNIFAGYQNTRLKIYLNEFEKPDVDGLAWNFFAELHYSKGEFELYRNTFTGAASFDYSGSEKGAYSYGARIYENTFTTLSAPHNDAAGHFQAYLDLESFNVENDIYIYRNHFKYSRIGVHYNNIYTSGTDFWIYSNIFENTGNADNAYSNAISIESSWDAIDPIELSNIYIYNNVIDAGTTCYGGINVRTIGDITNLNIRNNIINDGFSYPIRFSTDRTPIITTLNINNNIFYGNGSTTISYGSGITYEDRDATGNLTSNPLLTPTYSVEAGSPAISTGINVGSLVDYTGEYFNSTPSIGAYEVGLSTSLPTITTTAISSITNTTASSGGVITTDGGASVTARGVCWSTSINPTTANDKTSNGTGTGSFTSSITGLTNNTVYHVRAYATNSVGTAYGDNRSFQTNPDGGVQIGGLIKHNGLWVKRSGKLVYIGVGFYMITEDGLFIITEDGNLIVL